MKQCHQQLQITVLREIGLDSLLIRSSLQLRNLVVMTLSTVVIGSGMRFGMTRKRL